MFTNFKVSLAAARVNAGMTQDALSKAIGVSKDTVYNWENGKAIPTAINLRKLSELSGIPMDYIFVPDKSD